MRSLTIADPNLRAAVDDYALAIANISTRELQISDIDKEVLGAEGRLIQRVTELLRDVSERRGRVLSRDFARTLTEAKWQSIVLGTAGVLIGLFAPLLVVRRTVRPLAAIANSIRTGARGEGGLPGGSTAKGATRRGARSAPIPTTPTATSRLPRSRASWASRRTRARRSTAP